MWALRYIQQTKWYNGTKTHRGYEAWYSITHRMDYNLIDYVPHYDDLNVAYEQCHQCNARSNNGLTFYWTVEEVP